MCLVRNATWWKSTYRGLFNKCQSSFRKSMEIEWTLKLTTFGWCPAVFTVKMTKLSKIQQKSFGRFPSTHIQLHKTIKMSQINPGILTSSRCQKFFPKKKSLNVNDIVCVLNFLARTNLELFQENFSIRSGDTRRRALACDMCVTKPFFRVVESAHELYIEKARMLPRSQRLCKRDGIVWRKRRAWRKAKKFR